ncbi:DUF4145 domain-containing protein, partial [Streptococcus agalactiae]|nr:DUF4145 domain-containing protein [Streptococcus agalactiae]
MDKDNLYCSFCGKFVSSDAGSFRESNFSFSNYGISADDELIKDMILIQALKCPSCHEISIDIKGYGKQFPKRLVHFHPLSFAKQFPKYIPEQVRNDYEEAYSILNLSPKASATLSRRCLQGMIRDFWKVTGPSLYDELEKIKDKVEPSTVPVLTALRKLGNIGAHPEKDVNLIVEVTSNEALQLIQFIE